MFMYNNNYYLNRQLDYYNYNNNNYNHPYFTEDADSSVLFDPYNGFIRGNMFKNLYNSYKLDKSFEVKPLNEQAQLLTYIDTYSFAAHDIALYLDIYNDDADMIELFNVYRTEANRLRTEYENKYGPLFVNSNANTTVPWKWDDRPWPWEN